MKILILNAGSSSLKYHLFDMDSDDAIFQGTISNVGLDDSMHTYAASKGGAGQDPVRIDSHDQALELAFLIADSLKEGQK